MVRLREALAETGAEVEARDDDLIEISNPAAKPGRLITLHVRGDSDLDVAFHVGDKAGGPFEQVFSGSVENAREVQIEAVRLVADLVTERRVLGMQKGFFKGGRRFIAASELSVAMRKRLSWVVSWGGSFDSNYYRRRT
jgi:hypothetical protein